MKKNSNLYLLWLVMLMTTNAYPQYLSGKENKSYSYPSKVLAGQDINIVNDNHWTSSPILTSTSDGILFANVIDTLASDWREIRTFKSTNNGTSWTSIQAWGYGPATPSFMIDFNASTAWNTSTSARVMNIFNGINRPLGASSYELYAVVDTSTDDHLIDNGVKPSLANDYITYTSGTRWYVVYYSTTANALKFRFSANAGSTWSTPATLSGTELSLGLLTLSDAHCSMAYARSGATDILHVTYVGYDPAVSGLQEVYYVRSTDRGVTWSTPVLRSTSAIGVADILPTIDASGGMAVMAWKPRYGNGTTGIYYRYSSDGGLTWSTRSKLDSDSSNTLGNIALDVEPGATPVNFYVARQYSNFGGYLSISKMAFSAPTSPIDVGSFNEISAVSPTSRIGLLSAPGPGGTIGVACAWDYAKTATDHDILFDATWINPICSGTTLLTSSSGTFNDGSGTGKNYANDQDCKWSIQPASATQVTLNFSSFRTELDFDTVIIYNGATTASPRLGQFTGSTIPGTVISGGSMLVHFKTDQIVTDSGWTASYTSSTTASAPSAPTSLTATAQSSSQINLSWTASSSGSPTKYRVYRNTTSGSAGLQIDSVNSPTTTYNNTTGLNSSTAYYYTIFAVNATGMSTGSNQASATTQGASSAPSAPTGVTAVALSSSAIYLYWNASATGNPSIYRIINNGNQIDSTTFTGITRNGLSPASNYTYSIRAVNSAGTATSGIVNATTFPVTMFLPEISNVKSIGAYPSGLTSSYEYNAISLPFGTSINLSDILGNQTFDKNGNPIEWSLFEPINGAFFTGGTTVFSETGYLIYKKTGTDIFSNLGDATSLPLSAVLNLTITPGWNLIPWPQPYRANLQVTDNTKLGPFYSRTGASWSSAQSSITAEPFTAYAIQNLTFSSFTLDQYINVYPIPKAIASMTRDLNWHINFSARVGKFEDAGNIAGVKAGANDEFHITEDYAEPPFMGNDITLYFDQKQEKTCWNIQSASSENHVWDMVLRNGSGKSESELMWTRENLPESLSARLLDIDNNIWIDLAARDQYAFESRGENRFKVLIGTAEFVNSESAKLDKTLPKEFTLGQNYPNPFNPSTTIRFDMAKTSPVRIEIYNLLGQRVRVLVNNTFQTGHQAVLWNGLDDGGRNVSSGIYIYRMSTNGAHFSRKMLMVK